uniref:Piwi domain-containing protein n=1 Tax=Gongylonema pulchrum TaxID=637853 RepID=A0A183D4T9_9BILA
LRIEAECLRALNRAIRHKYGNSPTIPVPILTYHTYGEISGLRYMDMSRYDDLWSVYYISVENMVGQLPWRYVNEKNDVAQMKENIDLLRQKYGTVSEFPNSRQPARLKVGAAYKVQHC